MVKTKLIKKQIDDVFIWLKPISLTKQENTLRHRVIIAEKNGNVKIEFQNTLEELTKKITPEQTIYIIFSSIDLKILEKKIPIISNAKLNKAIPSLVTKDCLNDPEDNNFTHRRLSKDRITIYLIEKEKLGYVKKIFKENKLINYTGSQLFLGDDFNKKVHINITTFESNFLIETQEKENFGYGIFLKKEKYILEYTLKKIFNENKDCSIIIRNDLDDNDNIKELVKEFNNDFKIDQNTNSNNTIVLKNIKNKIVNFEEYFEKNNNFLRKKKYFAPLILLLLICITNYVGLEIYEEKLLKEESMITERYYLQFKSNFPNDKIIIDPLKQLDKKILKAKSEDRFSGNSINFFYEINKVFKKTTDENNSMQTYFADEFKFSKNTITIVFKENNPNFLKLLKSNFENLGFKCAIVNKNKNTLFYIETNR